MWVGLLLLLPTMERRAATSAMATDHAVASGMGRGEFQAAFANFRALTGQREQLPIELVVINGAVAIPVQVVEGGLQIGHGDVPQPEREDCLRKLVAAEST